MEGADDASLVAFTEEEPPQANDELEPSAVDVESSSETADVDSATATSALSFSEEQPVDTGAEREAALAPSQSGALGESRDDAQATAAEEEGVEGALAGSPQPEVVAESPEGDEERLEEAFVEEGGARRQ